MTSSFPTTAVTSFRQVLGYTSVTVGRGSRYTLFVRDSYCSPFMSHKRHGGVYRTVLCPKRVRFPFGRSFTQSQLSGSSVEDSPLFFTDIPVTLRRDVRTTLTSVERSSRINVFRIPILPLPRGSTPVPYPVSWNLNLSLLNYR